MKKKVVKKVQESLYTVINSDIGPLKPKNHPYNFSYISAHKHGLKVGDILRCDGFPFMSRPKPIYKQELVTSGTGVLSRRVQYWKSTISHKPVQLPTSLWVLRPIENID